MSVSKFLNTRLAGLKKVATLSVKFVAVNSEYIYIYIYIYISYNIEFINGCSTHSFN